MFRVFEKNSWEEVESIRSLWDELHEKLKRPDYVRSFSWLENYWKCASQDLTLKVLVVHVLDRPIGILPLVIKPYSTALGEVRMLTYPLDGWGVRFGPVGPNSAATLSGALKHIASSKRNWDFVDLKYVDREMEDKLRTPNGFRLAGLNVLERQWSRHAIVNLDEFSTFKECVSEKAYNEFQKSNQRLSGSGNSIQYMRYRSNSNEDVLLDQILEETREWIQANYGKSTQRLLERIARDSNESGLCDLNFLKIDNVPHALLWNDCRDGKLQAGKFLIEDNGKHDLQNKFVGEMLLSGQKMGDSSYVLPKKLGNWGTDILSTFRYTHFSRLGIKPQIMKWQNRIKRNLLASTGISTQAIQKAPRWKPVMNETKTASSNKLKLFTGSE